MPGGRDDGSAGRPTASLPARLRAASAGLNDGGALDFGAMRLASPCFAREKQMKCFVMKI
jgi:hypothetical protein